MLEIRNICAGYGEVEVLHQVSLNIEAGKIIALVGANAAGKTTLLSALSGLIRIKAGEVLFEGDRIDALPPHAIVGKGIVQVPEGRHLFPDMSIYENLLMGSMHKSAISQRGKTLEEIYELLPLLKERKGQMASSLSGGEAQMCAIARGLMAQPKLLMLDEPSLGLAPKAVLTCLDLICDLKERGITVLLVEQNVRASLQIADYAYVLENGSIVLEGKGEDLLDNEEVRKAYLGI